MAVRAYTDEPFNQLALPMRITPHRRLAVFALIAFVTWGTALAARAARGTPIVLPVEVVGEDGTTVSVTVDVPDRKSVV